MTHPPLAVAVAVADIEQRYHPFGKEDIVQVAPAGVVSIVPLVKLNLLTRTVAKADDGNVGDTPESAPALAQMVNVYVVPDVNDMV